MFSLLRARIISDGIRNSLKEKIPTFRSAKDGDTRLSQTRRANNSDVADKIDTTRRSVRLEGLSYSSPIGSGQAG